VDASVNLALSDQNQKYYRIPIVVGRVQHHFGLWFAAQHEANLLATSSHLWLIDNVVLGCSQHVPATYFFGTGSTRLSWIKQGAGTVSGQRGQTFWRKFGAKC